MPIGSFENIESGTGVPPVSEDTGHRRDASATRLCVAYNHRMDLVYLDNNATTQPAPEVVAEMLPYLTEFFGNPSSVHRFGQLSRRAIDEARGQTAALLGCSEAELLFTGGGTESINTAIRGLLASRSPRKRIITSTVEHPAGRELCIQLAREGAEIIEIPVDSHGNLDMDRLHSTLDDSTALLSIMWANNETGTILPVQEIGNLCRRHRVPFHSDATQAVGKVPIDLTTTPVDALSFAAHKFHGPKGVGGLFIRRGLKIRPLLIGGPQERNRRGGTENVPGIVGMGKAAELAKNSLPKMIDVAAKRDRFEQSIIASIPDSHVIGPIDKRIPNTTNIGFSRLQAEAILLLLSEKNICASAGSACSSGSLEPSHVLQAMRIDDKIAHGAIRFSLSRYTTDSEIDHALNVLPAVIGKLRMVM
jgi:cysteine desulfurase